jgi:hypothetical protein
MENVGIYYAHLAFVVDIGDILWSFGNLVVSFPRFGILCQEKSGNPAMWSRPEFQLSQNNLSLIATNRLHANQQHVIKLIKIN